LIPGVFGSSGPLAEAVRRSALKLAQSPVAATALSLFADALLPEFADTLFPEFLAATGGRPFR